MVKPHVVILISLVLLILLALNYFGFYNMSYGHERVHQLIFQSANINSTIIYGNMGLPSMTQADNESVQAYHSDSELGVATMNNLNEMVEYNTSGFFRTQMFFNSVMVVMMLGNILILKQIRDDLEAQRNVREDAEG